MHKSNEDTVISAKLEYVVKSSPHIFVKINPAVAGAGPLAPFVNAEVYIVPFEPGQSVETMFVDVALADALDEVDEVELICLSRVME